MNFFCELNFVYLYIIFDEYNSAAMMLTKCFLLRMCKRAFLSQCLCQVVKTLHDAISFLYILTFFGVFAAGHTCPSATWGHFNKKAQFSNDQIKRR